MQRSHRFFSVNLGHWFTISRWKTCTTFNWSIDSLSKDQFILTWITNEYSCTSLFGKHWFVYSLLERKKLLNVIGWTKSSCIWYMCINCISWNLSTSWSYCSILWITSMCTSIINNVTTKVCNSILFSN
jgi:hypothetical protein